jgi:arabinose-5-phosphate isomerase
VDKKQFNDLKICKNVIEKEILGIEKLYSSIENYFEKVIDLLYNCEGKVVVMGVGKSGHIGGKIAATFSSTGTPAFFLNPMDAIHGDIGVITTSDVIIAISKDGESEELLLALEYPRRIHVKVIAVTTNAKSSLAKISDIILQIPQVEEACPMNLAPTTSSTMTLVLGDCMAVCLMERRHFKKEQFAAFHPGGNLGKKLKKVEDIMTPVGHFALLDQNVNVKKALEAIVAIPPPNMGISVFHDGNKKVTGIITDGDLKRLLLKYPDLLSMKVKDVMIKTPRTIYKDDFVLNALNMMDDFKIKQLIVLNSDDSLAGLLDISDIMKNKIL